MDDSGDWNDVVATSSDLVGLGLAFGTIIGIVIVVAISWQSVAASYVLVRHALYHDQSLSRWKAARDVARQLLRAFRTHSLYRVVRLSTELQIFRPPPPPKHPDDYSRAALKAAEREHRQQLAQWRRETSRLMSILIAEIDGDGPVIRLGEWFEISAAEERLRRYFAIVNDRAAYFSLETDECISTVEIRAGTVAPLHLLRGLLHKFEEDWAPVVDSYDRTIHDPSDILRRRVQTSDLRDFQAYLFDCWLLWGPSIPICTCRQWSGDVALQLGYGDENNSVPILLDNEALQRVEKALRPGEVLRPLALPVLMHARIRHGGSIPRERLPAAQQSIRSGLTLVARDLTIRGGESDRPGTYYSAYVWVIFVILRENGRPLFQKDIWRGLLPFFEHVNIADGKALQVFKQQLAHKALSAIGSLVAPGDRVRFGFAAATDESGCGSALRFEPSPPRIREILSGLLEDEYRGLREAGIIDLSPSLGPDYSACHLPDVLDAYFASLEGQSP